MYKVTEVFEYLVNDNTSFYQRTIYQIGLPE